ncbi:MAG: CDP-diacylglycerol--serine O-phosphatidyltransferase [Oceanospirillaceae bacterium]|nr:CDP-diacylglycerol--serine O-phosphatidyltransferase [Oceanospirillaceae bacterium]
MLIRPFSHTLPSFTIEPEQFNVLSSAGHFRDYLLDAIHQAKTRIYLTALYLEDDEGGRKVLTAIYEAKQRNPSLDVVICVDWHRAQRGRIGAPKSKGNVVMYQAYAKKYLHSISVFGVPVRQREMFGVLHLKGFIIDDTVIYTGASLNNVHLDYQGRYRLDRYHTIESKPLADSMAGFVYEKIICQPAVHDLSKPGFPKSRRLKSDIRRLRKSLSQSTYPVEPQPLNANQVAVIPLIGVGKRGNVLNEQIMLLLAKATEEIILCTPYFNLPIVVVKAIKKAIKRGVKVHIIVGDKQANDFYIDPETPLRITGGLPYLYEMNLQQFAKNHEESIASGFLSIHLWKHDNNNYHLKGLWVDRQFMLLTGNNVNPRAWSLDLENALLIEDPEKFLEAKFADEFERIFQHTKRVVTYRQFDTLPHYPVRIQGLIKKITRIRADKFLKRIM